MSESTTPKLIHIAGQVLTVVDEKLVTAHGKSADGKPISFKYVSVRVRDA